MFSKILKLIKEAYVSTIDSSLFCEDGRNEEFYKNINNIIGNFNIYLNINSKDIMEMIKDYRPPTNYKFAGIRFIIDMETGDEYSYEAMESIHENVAKKLNIHSYVAGVWDYGKNFIYSDRTSSRYAGDSEDIENTIYESNIFSVLSSRFGVSSVTVEEGNDDIEEAYFDTLQSDYIKKKGEADIYINPTEEEIGDIYRELGYSVRWLIDDKNNLYIWDADKALHADVAKLLKLDMSTSPTGELEHYRSGSFSSYNQYRDFLKMVAQLKYPPNEAYLDTIDSPILKTTQVDVYENSSYSELAKLLKQYKTLRFYMNYKGEYIVWDANGALHGDILEEFPKWNHDLRGQISNGENADVGYNSFTLRNYKGTYLYVLPAHKFYSQHGFRVSKEDIRADLINQRVAEEFMKSPLYKNLEKIGITEVKLDKSL